VLSKNSHFSLHDGHALGWVSASKVYPQFEHFQLGMVVPPWLICGLLIAIGPLLLARRRYQPGFLSLAACFRQLAAAKTDSLAFGKSQKPETSSQTP